MKITVKKMDPLEMPKGRELTTSDVMCQDVFHMADMLGAKLMRLHANHSTEKCNYFILVDLVTGDRQKVEIDYESLVDFDLREDKIK